MKPPTPPSDPMAAIKYKYVLDTEHVILAEGRLEAGSGFLTLIQAMPRVLERFPDVVLIVIGTGPALHDILMEAHKLGVRGQMVFPGEVSQEDLDGLYQCCSVCVAATARRDKPRVAITSNEPGILTDALIAALAGK